MPRILVPLAHRLAVPRLARAAAKLAQLTGGEIVLLHVVDVPMLATLDDPRAKAEAAPLFALARAEIPASVPVRAEVRLAHLVGAEIRQAALDLKADVLIAGWREAFSLRNLVRGTLEPVLQRPPCDVLLADLDREDALDRIVELPGSSHDEIGARVVTAAARDNATGILLHDREPKTRAERAKMDARVARFEAFVRVRAPTVPVRLLVEATRRPLHVLAAKTARAFLILVAPGVHDEAPRVQPRPLARLERPLVAIVG